MNKICPVTRLALFLLLLVSQPLAAENRYQVEVIVFEHLSVDTTEVWPDMDKRPQWDNALNVFTDNPDSRFTPVSSGAYRMGGIYRSLRSSQGYRPILHVAWRQTGLPASRARAVYISSDNGQVEGQLQLEQSRYLHLNMDLIYPFSGGAGRYARLEERRRLRLKELHYFDNPVFGAIVQVTRADE